MKKSTKKTAPKKADAIAPRIEDRLVSLGRKLRLMEICFQAHFNLGENIDDVMADLDDLVRACRREVESLHKCPADILNWAPGDKAGAR